MINNVNYVILILCLKTTLKLEAYKFPFFKLSF